MTTLELQITDSSMIDTVIKTLSKFNCVKIKKKNEEYSEVGKGLITALKELDEYKKGERTFGKARDLFKNI